MNIPGSFTQSATKALEQAQLFAATYGDSIVKTGHLLVGFIRSGDELTRTVIREIDTDLLEQAVFKSYGYDKKEFVKITDISPHLHRVLLRASIYANSAKKMMTGTAQLWQELLYEEGCTALNILFELGRTTESLRIALVNAVGEIERPLLAQYISPSNLPVSSQEASIIQVQKEERNNESNPLAEFARNLTMEAREKKLEPLIGRSSEINSIIQILGKKTKNNPILIGEPGVGKTAVVEGLAQRIASGDIPTYIENFKIYALDMASVIAGTRFRGDFEERLKKIVEAIQEDGHSILFIDEVHTLIGSGTGSDGSIDAANVLKPALARGDFRVIGATTHNEYRKYIEKDKALARRFQRVEINEPSKAETINILRGIKPKYEEFHRIGISDESLIAAVEYSYRYIKDRFLPDKAIDLIDECSSMIKMGRKVNESESVADGAALIAAMKGNDVALQNELIRKRAQSIASKTISPRDVAQVVSIWTGIPVEQIYHEQSADILTLEKKLKKRVIGQEEAIHRITCALRRALVGLGDINRPLGVFLLLGSSGIGKTELCKAVAEEYFGSSSALIRIDMSEYSHESTISALIGSPPGYIGHGEGTALTDAVLKRPYSVVLFDEIEKAHPKVYNLLLQLFDNGQITDSVGRMINFRSSIIMMTSNTGISFDMDKQIGFSDKKYRTDRKHQIMSKVKDVFRPEFLGRVDEIIIMNDLSIKDGAQITELMLEGISMRLAERGLLLSWDNAIPEYIAKIGMDSMSGARNIRRTLTEQVENPLSDKIINSNCVKYHLKLENNHIFIE